MNVENIKRLIKHLQKEEVDYNQRFLRYDCGSPACIAGHAAYLCNLEKTKRDKSVVRFEYLNQTKIALEAEEFLELEQDAMLADELFRPFPFGRAPSKRDAIKVLEHLIETGEVDWGICLQETKQIESLSIGE